LLTYLQKSLYVKRALQLVTIFVTGVLVLLLAVSYVSKKNINEIMLHLVANALLGVEVKPAIISGINKDNTNYYVTSKGLRDYMKSFFFHKNVLFDYPNIDIVTADKTKVNVIADGGEFNEVEKIVNLYKNVKIKTSNGINLTLDKVYYNLSSSILYSNTPITIYNEQFTTLASGFKTSQKLKTLHLSPPVKIFEIANPQNVFLTQGEVQIATGTKIINVIEPFQLDTDKFQLIANNVRAKYITLKNIGDNLKAKSLSNFQTIDMEKVIFYNKPDNGKLIGDTFLYRQDKHIIILQSKDYTTYQSDTYYLEVKDRLEFQENKNIAVARGKNLLRAYDPKTKKLTYKIYADLMYFKLNKEQNDIVYAEAFDNIKVNTTTAYVTSNYAYLDKKASMLYMEDNVKIRYDNNMVPACRVVVDLKKNDTQVIPCNSSGYLEGTIKVKDIKKNEKKNSN